MTTQPNGRQTPDRGQPLTPAPRGSIALLVDPTFGPFFLGKLVSNAGVWMHNIAAAMLAFQLTRSAFVVGLVSVAQFVPQMFAPLSGAAADRGDRRRQLVIGRLISAAGSGGLGLWIMIVGVDGLPGAGPIIVTAFVVGVGFVVGGPAMDALLPALVRPGELSIGVALGNVPYTLARAGGPALGALVVTSAGPHVAFGIAAAANLVFAAIGIFLSIGHQPPRDPATDGSVREALRHLWRVDRRLVPLLIGIAAIGIGVDPTITLTPTLSAEFGRASSLVGLFASSFGIGAGLAYPPLGLIVRRIGMPRIAPLGLTLLAVGMGGLVVAPSPAVAVLLFGVGGAGMTFALSSLTAQIQERVPDGLRGRVMSLWSLAFLGVRPIAASVNGFVTDAWSLTSALLLVALLVVVAAWICRPT